MSGHNQERLTGFRKYKTVDGAEVLKQELDEVEHRRVAAAVNDHAIHQSDSNQSVQNQTSKSLVGLALSGGGIRSGAASLGVLRSLHKSGLLKFFDYMSTVSGGGYAGAWLSSAALCPPGESPDGNKAASSTRLESHQTLKALDGDKLSERMRQFIFGGHYLIRTQRFLNRYLIGLLLLWTVTFSGLAAVALLLSIAFRALDSPSARDGLRALGFTTDIHRGLFPVAVALALWLLTWAVTYFRNGQRTRGSVPRFFLVVLIITFGVAVAALLGNGEFGLGTVPIVGSINLSEFASGTQSLMHYLLYGIIGVGLLPYLRPRRLIRSGVAPQSIYERWIFAVSSRVVVYGIPFLMVSWFAHEDLSGWTTTRLVPPNMVDAVSSATATDTEPEKALKPEGFVSVTTGEISTWNSSDSLWSVLKTHEQEISPEHSDPAVHRQTGFSGKMPAAKLWADLRTGLKSWQIPEGWSAVVASSDNAGNDRIGSLLLVRNYVNDRLSDLDDCVRPEPEDVRSTRPGLVSRIFKRVGALVAAKLHRPRGDDANMYTEYLALRVLSRELSDRIVAQLDFVLKTEPLLFCNWEAMLKARPDDEAYRASLRFALDRTKNFYASHNLNALNFQAELRKLPERERFACAMIHRQLVAAAFPGTIASTDTILASNVQSFDQATRWDWFLCALGVFLPMGLIVNVNATALHGFYERELAENWIEPVPGLGREVPLSQLEGTNQGLPYHLIGSAVHFVGRRRKAHGDTQRDYFLFSRMFCGSRKSGYAPSEEYMEGQITLPFAVAVSGAAVSPLQQKNPLVRALLWLANLRLGQWVENPAHCSYLPTFIRNLTDHNLITPMRILSRAWQHAEDRPYFFVTDGGHHENLGIGALFHRRCRFILAIDAGEDDHYEFRDLTLLIRWARVKHSVDLTPVEWKQLASVSNGATDTSPVSSETNDDRSHSSRFWNDVAPSRSKVRLDSMRLSREHFVLLRVTYQDCDEPAWLVYVKSSLTGDEPIDLIRYAESDKEFPHNATADQFYDPDRFEAYRQLGEHMTDTVVRDLPGRIAAELAGQEVPDYIRQLIKRMQERSDAVPPPSKPRGASKPVDSADQTGAAEPEVPDEPATTECEPAPTGANSEIDDALERFSSGSDYDVRESEAILLRVRLLHDKQVIDAFIEALDDTDEFFRVLVLNILRDLGDSLRGMSDTLLTKLHVDRLGDRQWRLRAGVCTLLGELLETQQVPDPEIVEALLKVAEHPKSYATEKKEALYALTMCRSKVACHKQRNRIRTLQSRPVEQENL
ncbi:MAG: patatin-like phospholipase family protein [Rhodopirellula sp.]|nr:patatin-like phospholipase family protein [Rhodopirellula sp.]